MLAETDAVSRDKRFHTNVRIVNVTDTLTCIASPIAEGLCGILENLKQECRNRLRIRS